MYASHVSERTRGRTDQRNAWPVPLFPEPGSVRSGQQRDPECLRAENRSGDLAAAGGLQRRGWQRQFEFGDDHMGHKQRGKFSGVLRHDDELRIDDSTGCKLGHQPFGEPHWLDAVNHLSF